MSDIIIDKLKLKRSSVLDKKPTPDQLDYGEITINYNAGNPFISFKDSEGNIRTFQSGGADEAIYNTIVNLVANTAVNITLPNNIVPGIVTKLFINGVLSAIEGDGLTGNGNVVTYTPSLTINNANITISYSK